jgi:hypothetical protein
MLIRQGIATQKFRCGRLEEIVSKSLISAHLWVLERQFSGLATGFLPAGRKMPTEPRVATLSEERGEKDQIVRSGRLPACKAAGDS